PAAARKTPAPGFPRGAIAGFDRKSARRFASVQAASLLGSMVGGVARGTQGVADRVGSTLGSLRRSEPRREEGDLEAERFAQEP
ncbi:MAG: hypothetical protein ACUVXG_05990, partial [Anaerolineae bacterium]